ncbi:hypothetical protein GCM10010156_71930 [Planobispora rosea]|uniref:EAL domain-containing protein n=1 Tax=Planobispora rosea TaxID=35762 RepID=A0A8J3WG05_PLARO|nr:EAL domain-containing protein [Planobispora rosea]GGT03673.1 hypothetical protein GCM10010156_71930 [Planobispora rosea]GIH88759.1 hypothetical protein Pro02_71670 [Planobispora rosea]
MTPEDRRTGRDGGDDLVALILRVLVERAVFPLYQPIVDLTTGNIVAVEALARGPAGSPLEFPDALFSASIRAGVMPLLDQLCATRAMEIARDAGERVPPLLFFNAEPAALNQPFTPELLAVVLSERPYRAVLEFTERALADHPAALLDIAAGVQRTDGALALDDVGADPLSLAFLPLIEPEVIKLDMHLLRAPHAPATIATAAVVGAHAERTGAVVLAEGIETEHDAATARALGARWGQGWLFGRPGPLDALAGRPMDPHARLRPPRPDLHLPDGTPFTMAALRHHSRAGDQPMIDGLTDYLLSLAAGAGPHAVVLGAYPDPAVGRAWLPRLASLADQAAFVGVVGPAPITAGAHPVRTAVTPADGPAAADTVLAVVGPHTAAALCVRPGPDGGVDFVVSHEPDMVHAIARMLMRRLDTAAERLDPPAADRWTSPAVA